MDPAVISRLIQDAEKIFGFAFAVRTKRGLVLTSDGQQVVDKAIALVSQLQTFDDLKNFDPAFARIPTYTLGSRGFRMKQRH